VREYVDAEDDPRNNGASNSTPGVIVSAAEKSLADTLLPRFPERYKQLLGRRFEGGVDLSGGEWQKVALARAYMRDAQLLILDEPTASLDARAEYEVFRRFAGLMENRMAVIISHRFSTVRMADRIVVLDEGRPVEEGSHDELIARGGLYSELFFLQAEGYR
jgi:ATP-binding cassette subfamily B protein